MISERAAKGASLSLALLQFISNISPFITFLRSLRFRPAAMAQMLKV
jgi:hypothetical protein